MHFYNKTFLQLLKAPAELNVLQGRLKDNMTVSLIVKFSLLSNKWTAKISKLVSKVIIYGFSPDAKHLIRWSKIKCFTGGVYITQ